MRLLLLAVTLASLTAVGFASPGAFGAWEPAEAAPAAGQASVEALQTQGSDLEDATGIHYQNDANVHGDAPDTCQTVSTDRVLEADATAIPGMLVERDDEADAFHVPLGAEWVGQRLRLDILKEAGAELADIAFDIVDAACGFSVFDPDADIYHPGQGVPSEPFTARPAHDTYDYDASGPYTCDPSEWKFMIKHKRGINPSALYVEWSNGDYTYIANHDADPSQVAKYVTSHDVRHTVSRVAVQMPVGFDGELKVAHGPCDLTTATAPAAPSSDGSGGEFTLVREGSYVLVMTLLQGPVEKATGIDPALRCHEACFMTYKILGYEVDLHGLTD